MKRELILCFALAVAGGFFGGGASAPCRAAAVAPEGLHFIRIHMVDSKNGWAQAGAPEDHRVLHTANGGVSWVDVTPHTLPNRPWDFQFPSSRIAWISSYNQKTGFLLTTNAGASWVSWAPLVPPDDTHNYFLVVANCRLLNARDGLAECVDGAAGSSCYTFFDTHDGGLHWEAVRITPPGRNPENPPEAVPVSNALWYGAGITYYPPGKVALVHGDLTEGKPEGMVCLSLSTNLGRSWRDLKLPLPEKHHGSFCQPSAPFFLDASNGLLRVCAFKSMTDTGALDRVTIFYATHDGGGTWTPMPGTFSPRDPFSDHKLSFVSPRDIFVENGGTLYVTHDGAQSWRASNLGLGLRETGHDVSQMEFVDAAHGWIAVSGQGGTWASGHRTFYAYATVYETFNGGETWTELPLRVDQEANKREQRDEHQPERNFTQ